MRYLTYTQENNIGVLRINRPKFLNALNTALLAELLEQLETLEGSGIRALILTGAGEKAFVAGADIAEMLELSAREAEDFCAVGNNVMTRLEQFPVPVIAAINGYALGGGCELALACDIRLASENAVFGFPEVTLGIFPGFGGLQRLARAVGPGNARVLAFTAERIEAEEALVIGLVEYVYPDFLLLSKAQEMAEKIAANAPLAVKAAKRTLNASIGLTLREAEFLEKKAFGACFATQDQRNAMGAFLKRSPSEPFAGK